MICCWCFPIITTMIMIPICDSFRIAPPPIPTSPPWRKRMKVDGKGYFMIAPQQLGIFEPLTTTTITETTMVDDVSYRQRRRVVWENWIKDVMPIDNTDLDDNHKDYQPPNLQYSTVPFQVAWDYQKQLLQQHLDRIKKQQCNNNDDDATASFLSFNSTGGLGLDTVIMVQHDPVYTLGTASDEGFIHSNKNVNGDDEIPIVRIDRGGEVTYHGPGQLVVYPILDLRNYKMDIHWYVRALEEVVIRALHRSGMDMSHTVTRQANLTGIFVNDHYKVAAVGIKCRSWITQHGFAINITPQSIPPFQNIVPCGIPDRAVGCVHQFWNPDASYASSTTSTNSPTIDVDQNPTPPVSMAQMAQHVRSAFEDVFQVELVDLTQSQS